MSTLAGRSSSHSRRNRVVGLVATGLLLAWVSYKIGSRRSDVGRLSVDTGCDTDSTMAVTVSNANTPIRCEPWDIGTGVTGYVWRAPRATAALLFEPGWGDYAQRYVNSGSQLIPRLLERGVSVYSFDMWGTGRSPGKRGATDIGQAVADHLAARRKLREQPLPIFLLGHSVGGLVTATSAVSDRSAIEGMILLAPTLDWGLNSATRVVARVAGFLIPTFSVPGTGGVITQTRNAEAQRRMNDDPRMYHGPMRWIVAGGGASVPRANWERYPELRMPVLVVHGGADRGPDPSGSKRFISLVGSPDKTLSIIPDARHGLLDDSTGADVLELILAWLDRHQVNRATPP